MSAVFDFGAFPPEVNSAKMYAGPGSTSLLSAAGAWNGLASELRSQAANYTSIVSNLNRRRLARSGVDGYGGRGRAVHGVDEHDRGAGRADREPGGGGRVSVRGRVWDDRAPPVIAANRTQLASLVATNLLGRTGRRSRRPRRSTAKCGRKTPPPCKAMQRNRRQRPRCRRSPRAADDGARRACRGKRLATTQATGASTRAVAVATDVCGAHDTARYGFAGYLHIVVYVRTFGA